MVFDASVQVQNDQPSVAGPDNAAESSWTSQFVSAAVNAGWYKPLQAVGQIFKRDWKPDGMSQEQPAEPFSSTWVAQEAGTVVGTIPLFLLSNKIAGLGLNKLAYAGETADTVSLVGMNLTAAGMTTAESGLTGLAYGALFQPVSPQDGNFYKARAANGIVDAITFGTMAKASLSTQRALSDPLAGKQWLVRSFASGVGGGAGGIINAEGSSLAKNNRLASREELAQSWTQYGLMGLGFGMIGHFDTHPESAFNYAPGWYKLTSGGKEVALSAGETARLGSWTGAEELPQTIKPRDAYTFWQRDEGSRPAEVNGVHEMGRSSSNHPFVRTYGSNDAPLTNALTVNDREVERNKTVMLKPNDKVKVFDGMGNSKEIFLTPRFEQRVLINGQALSLPIGKSEILYNWLSKPIPGAEDQPDGGMHFLGRDEKGYYVGSAGSENAPAKFDLKVNGSRVTIGKKVYLSDRDSATIGKPSNPWQRIALVPDVRVEIGGYSIPLGKGGNDPLEIWSGDASSNAGRTDDVNVRTGAPAAGGTTVVDVDNRGIYILRAGQHDSTNSEILVNGRPLRFGKKTYIGLNDNIIMREFTDSPPIQRKISLIPNMSNQRVMVTDGNTPSSPLEPLPPNPTKEDLARDALSMLNRGVKDYQASNQSSQRELERLYALGEPVTGLTKANDGAVRPGDVRTSGLAKSASEIRQTSNDQTRGEPGRREQKGIDQARVDQAQIDPAQIDRAQIDQARIERTTQIERARSFYDGKGVPQNFEEALKWYKKAAEGGDADSALTVAQMVELGKVGSPSIIDAIPWYERSSQLGSDEAPFRLGQIYKTGVIGTDGQTLLSADAKQAAHWFLTAAERNNAAAQYQIAEAFRKGLGVSKDPLNEAKWANRAKKNGFG